MSDLQCPATVVLVTRSLLRAGANMSQLGLTRCSGVCVAAALANDDTDRAAATGLASQAGCQLYVLDEAVDAATLTAAIDSLADLYRGETLLVIAPDAVLHGVHAATNDPTRPIAVAIDSSGWVALERQVK